MLENVYKSRSRKINVTLSDDVTASLSSSEPISFPDEESTRPSQNTRYNASVYPSLQESPPVTPPNWQTTL
ncbi:hypothetical protein PoB_007372700 [Plakobranchus ocellatus]|uniref:Uncharacterized protein n=1 Tax=Plakobranchus ocellatus TaxID=259542 RepID=A0AAV4DSD2_9GAST|nr:hypothetical protein PoB_007372700 [Plakobranchus ocellatus]